MAARQLKLSYRSVLVFCQGNCFCLTGCVSLQDNHFVLPNVCAFQDNYGLSDRGNCLQDNVCGFPDNLGLSDRMKLPRQSLIVWPNGSCRQFQLSYRRWIVLPFLWIVFLLCLVLARQSAFVLPLPLCLCYL